METQTTNGTRWPSSVQAALEAAISAARDEALTFAIALGFSETGAELDEAVEAELTWWARHLDLDCIPPDARPCSPDIARIVSLSALSGLFSRKSKLEDIAGYVDESLEQLRRAAPLSSGRPNLDCQCCED